MGNGPSEDRRRLERQAALLDIRATVREGEAERLDATVIALEAEIEQLVRAGNKDGAARRLTRRLLRVHRSSAVKSQLADRLASSSLAIRSAADNVSMALEVEKAERPSDRLRAHLGRVNFDRIADTTQELVDTGADVAEGLAGVGDVDESHADTEVDTYLASLRTRIAQQALDNAPAVPPLLPVAVPAAPVASVSAAAAAGADESTAQSDGPSEPKPPPPAPPLFAEQLPEAAAGTGVRRHVSPYE